MRTQREDEKRAEALAALDTRTDDGARMVNDHSGLWVCSCCHEAIRVPAGVTVVHNGFLVKFDSWFGVLVDGQRVGVADSIVA